MVCSSTRRQAEVCSGSSSGRLDHAADAALGDLEAVALGDLLVAVVVLGERRGDRFEAVAGDLAGAASSP